MSENLKKTPLNQDHYDLGATMVDFGGWDMPVQYSGILEEHKAVRSSCGLFDVSHMGEIWVTGKDATAYINNMISSDITPQLSGQIKYGVLMMPDGHAVDDLLVYKYTDEKYLIVVNASIQTRILPGSRTSLAAMMCLLTISLTRLVKSPSRALWQKRSCRP